MKNFPMQKLRQAAKKSPQAKNLWVWEKSQASKNYIRGVIKGRKDTDGIRALWFWIGFLAGGVMGFYFASLFLFASFCN